MKKLLFVLVFAIGLTVFFARLHICQFLVSKKIPFSESTCTKSIVLNNDAQTRKWIEQERAKREKKYKIRRFQVWDHSYFEIISKNTQDVFQETGLRYNLDYLDFNDSYEPSHDVIRWKNYVIAPIIEQQLISSTSTYIDSNTYVQPIFTGLRVLNLNTNQLFSISLPMEFVVAQGPYLSLVGDSLYVVPQPIDIKPVVPPSFFKLSLPPSPSSRLTSVADAPRGVRKIGPNYISNDAYEGYSAALINPVTGVATYLERISQSSYYNEQEEMIGFDGLGNVIMQATPVYDDWGLDEPPPKQFEGLIAVPVANENETVELLAKEKYPEEIREFQMIEGGNRVLMIGVSTAYVFDLTTHVVSEVKDGSTFINFFEEHDRLLSFTSIGEAICGFEENTPEQKIAIDLKTASVLEKAPDGCKDHIYAQPTAEELFKKLDLPADRYELEFRPIRFTTTWLETVDGIKLDNLDQGEYELLSEE